MQYMLLMQLMGSTTNTVALTTLAVKPRASKREIATSSDRSNMVLIRWLIR